jgi:hypothetical protein
MTGGMSYTGLGGRGGAGARSDHELSGIFVSVCRCSQKKTWAARRTHRAGGSEEFFAAATF